MQMNVNNYTAPPQAVAYNPAAPQPVAFLPTPPQLPGYGYAPQQQPTAPPTNDGQNIIVINNQPAAAPVAAQSPAVAQQAIGPASRGAAFVNPVLNTDDPANTVCPSCQQRVQTLTRGVNGTLTWVVAGSLFFLGCWPFCIIPLFCKKCQDIEHTCPSCQGHIYTYKKM
ncbi:lipopolysaccharide-induced tumor necrosis factor-alpha factor homolog [Petromyzon marinus]|uniref:lipopolysaccharide-induced tumor necrosis factor-alpha factor homolog n=1 Tax=Petromyzon marinus TaxID=7757 RepID=UPI003F70CE10